MAGSFSIKIVFENICTFCFTLAVDVEAFSDGSRLDELRVLRGQHGCYKKNENVIIYKSSV